MLSLSNKPEFVLAFNVFNWMMLSWRKLLFENGKYFTLWCSLHTSRQRKIQSLAFGPINHLILPFLLPQVARARSRENESCVINVFDDLSSQMRFVRFVFKESRAWHRRLISRDVVTKLHEIILIINIRFMTCRSVHNASSERRRMKRWTMRFNKSYDDLKS